MEGVYCSKFCSGALEGASRPPPGVPPVEGVYQSILFKAPAGVPPVKGVYQSTLFKAQAGVPPVKGIYQSILFRS